HGSRKTYKCPNLFACSGLLFNHGAERFVCSANRTKDRRIPTRGRFGQDAFSGELSLFGKSGGALFLVLLMSRFAGVQQAPGGVAGKIPAPPSCRTRYCLQRQRIPGGNRKKHR